MGRNLCSERGPLVGRKPRQWATSGRFSHRLEDIPLIVINLELAQEFDVFLPKCLTRMMPLLILDVADYCINLGPGVGKSTKAFLPGKSSTNPSLLINQPGRVGSDILSQFRHRQFGGQSDQKVYVVRHVINCQELLGGKQR